MDKYSKITSNQAEKLNDEGKIIHGGIEILKTGEDAFAKEKDMVIILPYLVDEGFILMRSEQVPAYQFGYKNNQQYKNVTNFISAISGCVDVGEHPINAVRRELYDNTGLVLSDTYLIDISKPLFFWKSNCTKVYTCLLEIRYNDYRQTIPKNVNSPTKTIKVDLGYLDEIVVHDLPTEMILDKLRLSLPKNK